MDREKVIGHLNDCMEASRRDNTWVFVWKDIVEDAIALLKEQKAVVRCKDCRYGQYCTDGETTYQCFKWNSNEFGALHEQDWFCADGERKK